MIPIVRLYREYKAMLASPRSNLQTQPFARLNTPMNFLKLRDYQLNYRIKYRVAKIPSPRKSQLRNEHRKLEMKFYKTFKICFQSIIYTD